MSVLKTAYNEFYICKSTYFTAFVIFSDFYPVIIGCNYDIWTKCLFLKRFAITQDPLIQYYSSKTDDYSQNILSTLIREYKGSYHSNIQVVTHLYILFCSYIN
jgi:hypothetical protein